MTGDVVRQQHMAPDLMDNPERVESRQGQDMPQVCVTWVMHVTVEKMTSISTTARENVSKTSTQPSMKDIIIADAGEGVTSKREHIKSTLIKAGMYMTNHSNQEREEHIVMGHMAELISKDQPSREDFVTTIAGRTRSIRMGLRS